MLGSLLCYLLKEFEFSFELFFVVSNESRNAEVELGCLPQ